MYAGKYLNTYGEGAGGGVRHVPPGWDWWLGQVGNARYYNYTLSVNGKAKRCDATVRENTSLIYSDIHQTRRRLRPGLPDRRDQAQGRQVLEKSLQGANIFLVVYDGLTLNQADTDSPFLMVLSPPGAHAPFTPAPQFEVCS